MKGNTDIRVYPGIFPEELCKRIIEKYNNDSRKAYAEFADGYVEYRHCKSLPITYLNDWAKEDSEVFSHIYKAVEQYLREYSYPVDTNDVGYTVVGYEPGEGCDVHIDADGRDDRFLSVVVYLNDVRDGGELVFPKQDISIKPVEGTVVIFPSTFTYPHHVLPPNDTTRYAIVTWLTKPKGKAAA